MSDAKLVQVEPHKEPAFLDQLEDLINRHSMENGSDTPDYILANFLGQCLIAFNEATTTRDKCHGFNAWPKNSIKEEAKTTPEMAKEG
jgi:hypothetical protein